ncbi:MAG: S-methyl-5-thioribose-1-phosphate isomerase [Anaerolinea sp.]|nr:S-methyl-5-thioribose-1-phosphate isomerase [Anaerolinea sp.]
MTVVPLRILRGECLEVLDQTLLPGEERHLALRDVAALCEAVASLRVRGAPLLGIVGAAGMAIAAERGDASDGALRAAYERIAATRPTAVELASIARLGLEAALAAGQSPAMRRAALWAFVEGHLARRMAEDLDLATRGASLLPQGCAVLTHCNTGALATGGIGTALGVIQLAWQQGKLERCYATETRPLLQGARLTMWELAKLGIPGTLLPDTAAASLIASGRVQAVITGADRIARNGDTANKVGTYGLAAVAARHGVPFYIAAPVTTIDPSCPDGAAIPIEFRPPEEVGGFGGVRWSPPHVAAYNPAFDVTPAGLISAIVTEQGVLRPPYASAIAALTGQR